MIRKCDSQFFKIILTFSMMYGYHLAFKNVKKYDAYIIFYFMVTENYMPVK